MAIAEGATRWVSYVVTRGFIRGPYKRLVGMTVTVKASEAVEDFMKLQANPKVLASPLEAVTDGWVSMSGESLSFYNTDESFSSGSNEYSLTNIGHPILVQSLQLSSRTANVAPSEVVNLSLLKLVGISKPEGVTIGLPGTYSPDYISRVRTGLHQATKKFLHDFLVPSSVTIELISAPGKW